MKIRISLSFLLLCAPLLSVAQSYKYKLFSEKDGLKNRFVYTLDQDRRGYLMIGTGDGLYSYNGFEFVEYNTTNGLPHNFVTCSTIDEDGAIWYGFDNGSLTWFLNGKTDTVNLNEYTHSRINQIICQDGFLWLLSQNDGILRRDKEGQWTQFSEGLSDFTLYSFFVEKNNRIWLGTDVGLLLLSIQGKSMELNFVDEISESKVSHIFRYQDNLYVGTDDKGIFTIDINNGGNKITPLNYQEMDFSSYEINSLFVSSIGDLWICTNNKGLIQLSAFAEGVYRKMKTHDPPSGNLQTKSFKVCVEDKEGDIWAGTIGGALLKIQDSFLTLFNNGSTTPEKIYSVYEYRDTIWSGGRGSIYVSTGGLDKTISTFGKEHGLPQDEITCIQRDNNGNFWIGTGESGLYQFNSSKKKSKKNPLSNEPEFLRINDILTSGNLVYVASNYGIYQFLNGKLISHLTIQSGLSSNSVKSLYRDVKGNIWIATTTGHITYIDRSGGIKDISTNLSESMVSVRCITEDNNGNIWMGTDGLGVLKIAGDSLSIVNRGDGIYSDYCYSIICDSRNNLWIGHHGAISKFNLLNAKVEVFNPNGQYDTDFFDNAVYRTSAGNILFGTTNGVLLYSPENDIKNEVEPSLLMEGVFVNDSLISTNQEIHLKYGKYNVHFEFIGISLKNATGVSYQYYLEGYDNGWLPVTKSSSARYNKLSPGSYTFHLRNFNSDGFGGIHEISIHVFVDKPFWQKWWFIFLAFIAGAVILKIIVDQRERILVENQIRLQSALDERTKEVVEQKELLEIRNKDITDSILYARNIQQAMLPNQQQLKQHFADSFIFFKPRDIVSGDFYWVEEYGDIVVVACADCTGHGVPGAFMSLIGSTLLKDVSNDKEVKNSSDVLTYLNKKLNDMLHKQGEDFYLRDGMDMTVMDYNKRTGELRFASANRPVLLHINGEWMEVSGDRLSIGGEKNMHKEFKLHELNVKGGDSIYLFSDGIIDQFGGAKGKKLKRSGLKSWLQQSISMNMNKQLSNIQVNFKEWTKSEEQIDDVILLGIRF